MCTIAFLLLAIRVEASEVSVSGADFLLDGKPWIAEGVVLVGLLAPGENFRRPSYAKAYRDFNVGLLDDIREFGADLIRLKASEPALDPQSPSYQKDYPQEVVAMVRQVRKAGFVVILSMLRPDVRDRMPNKITVRAWHSIIGEIGQDRAYVRNF